MTFLLFVLAFGPSLIWAYWLWSRDKFQREPLGLMARLIIGGGIISVTLTFLTVPLYHDRIPTLEESVMVNMFLTAALPEELFKMLPVLLFAWRSRHWTEPFDGIIYAGATALGFHLIETSLYMYSNLESGLADSLYQGMIRGAKPGHMLYGVAMGYFLSRARFSHGLQRVEHFFLSLAVPVLLHTAWNTGNAWGGSFVGAQSVSDLIVSLVAWGLSVALWVTAYQYMRVNQANSPWHPKDWTLPLASTCCPVCGGHYPEASAYCHTCGNDLRTSLSEGRLPRPQPPESAIQKG